MKEYDCGENYELGERLELNGEIVEVVRDDEFIACKECRIAEIFRVKCSSFCMSHERRDGESIAFKLVAQAKKEVPISAEYPEYDPSKEYAVYERFQYNGVVAECRKCESAADCRECALYTDAPCACIASGYRLCMGTHRKDGLSVYYKKLEDVRP